MEIQHSQRALDKVTVPLLKELKRGESINLPNGYTLYHYEQADSIVLINDKGEELFCVLFDEFSVEYHALQ